MPLTVAVAKPVPELSPPRVSPSKTPSDRDEPQTEKHTDECTTKRFRGTVIFFRGCFGWVTSDDVRTDWSVNPQGKSWIEIHNAISSQEQLQFHCEPWDGRDFPG